MLKKKEEFNKKGFPRLVLKPRIARKVQTRFVKIREVTTGTFKTIVDKKDLRF